MSKTHAKELMVKLLSYASNTYLIEQRVKFTRRFIYLYTPCSCCIGVRIFRIYLNNILIMAWYISAVTVEFQAILQITTIDASYRIKLSNILLRGCFDNRDSSICRNALAAISAPLQIISLKEF